MRHKPNPQPNFRKRAHEGHEDIRRVRSAHPLDCNSANYFSSVNGKESAVKRMIFGLCFLLALGSGLQAQSTFYAGKSIKLIVGSPAGSNYDQYGRLLAPYLGKYIA